MIVTIALLGSATLVLTIMLISRRVRASVVREVPEVFDSPMVTLTVLPMSRPAVMRRAVVYRGNEVQLIAERLGKAIASNGIYTDVYCGGIPDYSILLDNGYGTVYVHVFQDHFEVVGMGSTDCQEVGHFVANALSAAKPEDDMLREE